MINQSVYLEKDIMDVVVYSDWLPHLHLHTVRVDSLSVVCNWSESSHATKKEKRFTRLACKINSGPAVINK